MHEVKPQRFNCSYKFRVVLFTFTLKPALASACPTDSEHIVHASIDERGSTKGRKAGDQTGKEICIRKYYTPSYGWDYHLRYNGDKGGAGYAMNLLKSGVSNIDVTVFEILMTKLGYYSGSIDTKYGTGCVRACKNFQSDYGLTVDGQCGKNTWNKLFSLGIR